MNQSNLAAHTILLGALMAGQCLADDSVGVAARLQHAGGVL